VTTVPLAPGALPAAWRARASELRRYAPPAAEAYLCAAQELEEAIRAAQDEQLTLQEAALESGYSVRRLRELVADGSIPQAGEKGRPRIRRGDLPRRAGAVPASAYDMETDAAELAGRVA
jgi:hypothetical protein